jgi:mutator protein MutT
MKIRVVAAVIEREGRLLVCQRAPLKRHGGLWEFPGGKVDVGETDFEAVERELSEELGVMTLEVGPRVFSMDDLGSAFIIEFLSVRVSGEVRCIEHVDLAWLPPEELLSLPLAPTDKHFVEHLLRQPDLIRQR